MPEFERRRLLTTNEAAVYLGLSANYIRDMIMDGDCNLPYINISRGDKASFRFDIKDLDLWVDSLKREANEPRHASKPLFEEQA
jgi:excisionase family DNA binding protein